MSWSRHSRSIVMVGFMLASGALLGSCSFQPVYSGTLAANPTLDIAYAEPTSRLEQIIYQELELRLGSSPSAVAPLASVTVSQSSGGIAAMTSNPGPNAQTRIAVTATLTFTRRDGNLAKPLVISRSAPNQDPPAPSAYAVTSSGRTPVSASGRSNARMPMASSRPA